MNTRPLLCLFAASLVFALGVAQAQTDTAQTFAGVIDNDAPFFEAAFTVAEDDSTITLDLSPTGGDLDTLVYLVDRLGNIIDENDDRERGNPASLLVYPYAPAGQYRVIATRYGALEGKTSGTFELNIGVQKTPTPAPIAFDVTPEALRAAGFPEQAPQSPAQWTIFAYYGADTDLEPGLLKDFKEFELAGGSSPDVRVLLLMDRSPEFSNASGDWHNVRLFEVSASTSSDAFTVDTQALASFADERDASSTGELLAQYLVWGIRHYPAQRYAITFGSHGAAWEGLIQDNGSIVVTADGLQKPELISLPELSAALNLARQEAGVNKFDLLINDACSMSSVEYFSVMSDFFDLSLASPEVVSDPALDMTLFTTFLRQNPQTDLNTLGKQLVDRYMDVDIPAIPRADNIYLSHTVSDLSRLPKLRDAVEEFARVFNLDPVNNVKALGEARRDTYVYSGFLGSQTKVDLGDLMRQIIANPNASNQLSAAAANVLTALDGAILYARNGGDPRLDNMSYYNIFFPQDAQYFRRRDYFADTSLREWGLMLRNYFSVVNPKPWESDSASTIHEPLAPQVNISAVFPQSAVSVVQPSNLRVEVAGRNLSSITSTIDQIQPDGSAIRYSQERILLDTVDENGVSVRLNDWNDGVNVYNVYWDVKLPVLTDGNVSSNELLVFTEEPSEDACVRAGVAFLDGYYREPNSTTWNEVSVIFNIVRDGSGEVGRVQRIISKNSNSGALAAINIAEGSDFVAFRSIVTPDGRVSLQLGTTYYKWPSEGLTYTWQPAPNGNYNYGILAKAFGGTSGFAATPLEVQNDGVDTRLRGDNVPFLGYTLPRPADWLTAVDDFDVVDFNRSTNCDNSQNITVYYLTDFDTGEAIPNDVDFIRQTMLDLNAWESDGTSQAVNIGGVAGAQFDYAYTDASGQAWQGRGIALYEAYNEIGMVFSAETRQDLGGLEAIFAILSDHLRLYDIQAYFDSATLKWETNFLSLDDGRFVDFSHPVDWLDRALSDWERYVPYGDPNSPSFFAYRLEAKPASQNADYLDSLADSVIAPATSNYQRIAKRAYSGNLAWDVVLYSANRNGIDVLGRFYISDLGEQVLSVWIEYPNNPAGVNILTNVLEMMVDSFVVAE